MQKYRWVRLEKMAKETRFGKWYRKWIGKWIPEYGILLLLVCCLFNNLIYWGAQQVMGDAYHYDFTTSLDRKVPFVKEWVLIYVASFVFWAFNYILISREGKEKWYRFVTADLMSRLICGVFFFLLPTTNVRPEVLGNDFTAWVMRLVYDLDEPTNLFPSIHCLVSWFCYIGIAHSKKVPKWYQSFSFVFAVLICASTQFTKQHYLIDIAGGIFIAEICYLITSYTDIYRVTEWASGQLEKRIFGVTHHDE